MSNIVIVLFSNNDKSRDFPSQCPQDGSVQFCDVSGQTSLPNSIPLDQYLGTPFQSFPTVTCTVMASGAATPLVGQVIQPVSWDAAAAIVNASDNQAELVNTGVWGAFQAGAAISGPILTQFYNAVYTGGNLSLVARNSLAQFFPLLNMYATSNPGACALYWSSLKVSPPSWLDAAAISYVESMAQLYNIPIVGVSNS